MRETAGPKNIAVYGGSAGTTLMTTISPSSTSWTNSTISFTSTSGLNTTGTTLIRIYGYDSNNEQSNADLMLDNVTFTGCIPRTPPTIIKSFSPDPITYGQVSTLTFTLTNTNDTQLTGVSFADALPTGMTIASTPSVSTTGCGSPTVTASAGATSIGFTGGTIQAKTGGVNGVCTVSVNVTAPDKSTVYTNTSGYISSTETGVNTDTGGSATDTLTVNPIAPVIDKVFSPNPIAVGGTSVLTITLTNPNQNTQLTNLAFTDSYPTNLVNTSSPAATTNCGGTVTAASGGGSVSLSGGTLDAGKSCSVTVNVTSSSAASYPNSTSATASASAVSGTLNLTSNTASDTLVVTALTPEITLNKEIGLSATGPWSSSVNVSAGTNVYYRFTIENTGDVNLSPVWVVDDKLSGASACSWPATLPTASTGNSVATCVVGPVAAGSSSSTNTATAKGTYSGTTYTSNTSNATYNITSLQLTKTVSPTIFTSSTTTLSYSYTIKNNGASAITGTFSISDTNATVTCNQPAGGSLAAGASMTCSATYTLTDRDRSIGYVSNIASGSVAISGGGTAKTNTTSATSIADKPDLVISKTATFTGGQATVNTPFTWTFTVSNNGGGTATFTNGQKVLTDTLPSGANYTAGTPDLSGLTNNSGTLSCSITGSELSCTVSSGSLVIESGKHITTTVSVTPTSTGTLINTATVDPDKVGCDATNGCVTESNEGNNTGQSEVTVSAALPNIKITKTNNVSGAVNINESFTWTLLVEYSGSGATFTNGQKIVSDSLPGTSGYYTSGTQTVTKGATAPSGTIDCVITGTTLNCTANGSVSFSDGASFSVAIPVTPTSTGTLTNTAVVNPDFLFAESSTA
ncbi:MAG: beta strand repeat-containing protein, partial [Chloroflexota bacterium]